MMAWESAKALHLQHEQARLGCSMQDHYDLLARGRSANRPAVPGRRRRHHRVESARAVDWPALDQGQGDAARRADGEYADLTPRSPPNSDRAIIDAVGTIAERASHTCARRARTARKANPRSRADRRCPHHLAHR